MDSGLVVNAASVVLFLYIKGRKHVFAKGASRLALVTFSIMSALWAQTSFVATLLNITSATSCQVVIVFATLFDQIARPSLIQALIWEINKAAKPSTAETGVTQGLLLLRFILGSIFVGFQRPQLDTVCVTRNALLPIGIVVFLVDTVFVAGLLIRVAIAKSSNDAQIAKARKAWKRAIILAITGLGIWTIVSGPELNANEMKGHANRPYSPALP